MIQGRMNGARPGQGARAVRSRPVTVIPAEAGIQGLPTVIPAKAGIQGFPTLWIPAFAGMTTVFSSFAVRTRGVMDI